MNLNIAIIIPCFNEAARLEPDTFTTFLKKNSQFYFIFINDGSTDATPDKLDTLRRCAPGQTTVISLPENSGKAQAIRIGVQEALRSPFNFIGFWDADLATPLTELHSFEAIIAENETIQMICGSRVKRLGSTIERFWYRHYAGRIVATCISIILNLPVYDTQCGAKIFKRELAETIFIDPFISRWLFDIELIARIIGQLGRKFTLESIHELPLKSWKDMSDSKISPFYLPKVPLELARISYRYRAQLKKP